MKKSKRKQRYKKGMVVYLHRASFILMLLVGCLVVLSEPMAVEKVQGGVNDGCVNDSGSFIQGNCQTQGLTSFKFVKFFTTSVTTMPAAGGLRGQIAEIMSSYTGMYVRLNDGSVQGWGHNAAGNIGAGHSNTPVLTPEPMLTGPGTPLTDIVEIAPNGSSHTCAMTSTGAVYCMGSNNSGAVGNGIDTVATAGPHEVIYATRIRNTTNSGDFPTGVIDEIICANSSGNMAFDIDAMGISQTYSWGWNRTYDRFMSKQHHTSYTNPQESGYAGTRMGNRYGWSIAQFTDQTVLNGSTMTAPHPDWDYHLDQSPPAPAHDPGANGGYYQTFPIAGDELKAALDAWRFAGFQVRQIVMGSRHSCALLVQGADERVHCWGANDRGQLGMGDHLNSTTPPNEFLSPKYRRWGTSSGKIGSRAWGSGRYHTVSDQCPITGCWRVHNLRYRTGWSRHKGGMLGK